MVLVLDFKRDWKSFSYVGKQFFPACVAAEILCLNRTVEVDEFLLLKALSLFFELNLHLMLVMQVFCLSILGHLHVPTCSCGSAAQRGKKKVIPKNRLQKQKLKGHLKKGVCNCWPDMWCGYSRAGFC